MEITGVPVSIKPIGGGPNYPDRCATCKTEKSAYTVFDVGVSIIKVTAYIHMSLCNACQFELMNGKPIIVSVENGYWDIRFA